MTNWREHVLPHGELTALDDRLWQVQGSLPRGPLPRNMTLYTLDGGGLLIHGAQALNDEAMAKLESLGTPRVMIVPSPFHNLHEALYKQRYPELTVLCPAAAKETVSKEVQVDGTVEDDLAAFGVPWLEPAGLKPIERAYRLELASGHALLVGDILMNIPHLPGFDGFLMRLLGSTGFFGMTRVGKLLLLKNKAAFRTWLTDQANEDGLRFVCVAHGESIRQRADDALRAAADRL